MIGLNSSGAQARLPDGARRARDREFEENPGFAAVALSLTFSFPFDPTCTTRVLGAAFMRGAACSGAPPRKAKSCFRGMTVIHKSGDAARAYMAPTDDKSEWRKRANASQTYPF